MKLQFAVDVFKMDNALELVDKLTEHVDIVEMGTPFIIDYGMESVRRFAEKFPEKEILADEKIMDGGFHETELAIKAGAEYVTVLAVTDDLTIKGCLEATKKYGKQLVVDFIGVDDLAKRVREVEALGVDVLAVHTASDRQAAGFTPLADLKIMKETATRCKIAVAGGINSKTIDQYVALKPDIVIVGSAIANADDPVEEARLIKQAMEA